MTSFNIIFPQEPQGRVPAGWENTRNPEKMLPCSPALSKGSASSVHMLGLLHTAQIYLFHYRTPARSQGSQTALRPAEQNQIWGLHSTGENIILFRELIVDDLRRELLLPGLTLHAAEPLYYNASVEKQH